MAITGNSDHTINWFKEKTSTQDGTEHVLTARYSELEWIITESDDAPGAHLFGHIIPVDVDRGFTLKNGERLWSRAAIDPRRPVAVRT